MKKTISVALSVASAAMLSASVIDWELPNLSDDNGALTYGINDIIFIADTYGTPDGTGKITLTDSDYKTTVEGSNTLIDSDEESMSGEWTDNLSGTVTYYMAMKSGDSYYAISNGQDPAGALTVTVNNTSGNDPLKPNSSIGGSIDVDNPAFSSGARTVAPTVPEPTTAALALAGLAMLVRRRRVA